MYVEEDYQDLSPGLQGMYEKMKEMAKANKGKWVCVYEGIRTQTYEDYFYLANSKLRFESELFNWSPFKIDIVYPPRTEYNKVRIMVKYK